jgi:hypothetical protein
MRRTVTFEEEYEYFEPCTLVTPSSRRSVLEVEHVYRVTGCQAPMFPGESAVCFVEGHRNGVDTSSLRMVSLHELNADRTMLTRPNFWSE